MSREKSTNGSSPHVSSKSFDNTPTRGAPRTTFGRSPRDMDEEIMKLRNENFNLKLRLHFKDGAAKAKGGPRVDDTRERELRDAKALINALRIEVNEKTQLLKDAAVAITEHEDKEREFVIATQTRIAELEAYIVHLQEASPREAILLRDLKRMEEKVAHKAEELQQTKKQIEQLRLELAEHNKKFVSNEERVQQLSSQNAEILKLLEQHHRFSLLTNNMMDTQRKKLEDCLNEKQSLIKKINTILPELNSQNELLKEATITVLNLLESTGLKEQITRRMLDNYKTALSETKVEIQNIKEDLVKWLRTHGMVIDLHADGSSNSDQSSEDLGEFPITGSTQPLESESLKELGNADHSKGCSSGKRVRGKTIRGFTGLRQFVKCWGRKYSK